MSKNIGCARSPISAGARSRARPGRRPAHGSRAAIVYDALVALTTRTSHYRLRPDGIVVQEIFRADTHTMADAEENVAAFNTVAAGRKRPCLVDMRVTYQADRGVREYYGSAAAAEWCSALGMLVRSQVTRIIGNLFLAMNRTPLPARMFTSEAEAVAWLQRFKAA